jgi:uncharacterized alkaline shock family protein YloU
MIAIKKSWKQMKSWKKNQDVDQKEYDLPETVFVRDIEDRVFKSIALQTISKIEGVSLDGGSFLDHLFGRDKVDAIKGVQVVQDSKNHSVSLKVEVKVKYGVAIPEKADEIQNKVSEEITSLTGLHVNGVHVVFKNVFAAPEELDGESESDETPDEDEHDQ